MIRATWLPCLLIAAAVSVSCGRKPDAPERDAPAAPDATDAADTEDEVGVGDVVDYAIGKTQLEAKKRIEAELDAIQADRERRIKEALGE